MNLTYLSIYYQLYRIGNLLLFLSYIRILINDAKERKSRKVKNSIESTHSDKTTAELDLVFFLKAFCVVTIIVILLTVIVSNTKYLNVLFLFFRFLIIPMILYSITYCIEFTEEFQRIINISSQINHKQYLGFLYSCYCLSNILNIYPPEKTFAYILSKPYSSTAIGIITAFVLLVYLVIILFLVFSNCIVLIQIVGLVMSKTSILFEKCFAGYIQKAIARFNGSIVQSNELGKLSKEKKVGLFQAFIFINKWIYYFIKDVIISTVKTLWIALSAMVFVPIFSFVNIILRFLASGLQYCISLPNGLVIRNSFRLSAIISLVCTVLSFRIFPIVSVSDGFIDALEFISSTIIIPVMLDWFFSIRPKTAQ